MMEKETFVEGALEIFQNLKQNYITEDYALRPELAGMQIFDEPIFGVAYGKDPLFDECKEDSVLGPRFMLPTEWLPGTVSVISYFLPYTDQIKQANAQDMAWPASEWLHGRIEGQLAIKEFGERVALMLVKEGYPALVPANDIRFSTVPPQENGHIYSNWSERHVAYIAGLGTFSMSRALITAKGTAGRLGSIVTNLLIPADNRPYSDVYEYCSRCGACAANCPVQAIDPQKEISQAKDQLACFKFLGHIVEMGKAGQDVRPPAERDSGYQPAKTRPRYGCGKCQVKTPCQDSIPTK